MPDTAIPGANTSTHVLTSEDVGKILYCRVTATNVAGSSSAVSNQRGPITALPPVAVPPSITTAPSIADDTPEVDAPLTTTFGVWAGDTPLTYSYEWHRVTVSSDTVPSNTTLPAITGSLVQGATLTTTDGLWSGSPSPTFSRQWKSGAANVGTGAVTYVTTVGDVGASITCVVTATNAAGAVPATSNSLGPITAAPVAPSVSTAPSIADATPTEDDPLTVDHGIWAGDATITYAYEWHKLTGGDSPPANSGAAPAITGSAIQGSVLTATDGVWTGSPTPTLTRQWKRGSTNVGTGATTYTTTAGDIGSNITCVVTGTNTSGVVNATSNAIGPITAIPAISLVCGPVYAGVNNTATAATITFPVTPAAGDVVYVFGGMTAPATAITIATSGYTVISTCTGSFISKVFRKVLTGADTSVTSGANVVNCNLMIGAIVLRGVNATPEDATPTNDHAGGLSTSPAITTTTADAWVLSLMCGITETAPGGATSAPSGYTNFAGQSTAPDISNDYALSLAASTKLVATAGVEDPGNYFNDWLSAHGHTVAVRKA